VERARSCCRWAKWFEGYDVLLCRRGACRRSSWAHRRDDRALARRERRLTPFEISQWLMIVNLVHLPSVMAPIGHTGRASKSACDLAPYLRDPRAIRVAGLLGGSSAATGPPGFQ
jgi:hypothetical protein